MAGRSVDGVRMYTYSCGMTKLVCHLDSDCFYVSCERIRDVSLRRVPASVLGNQGACVIAKSYEAKACGVKTGMPIWDAVRLCPLGVYLKRDFHWYEVISGMLLELLKSVSPSVEYYSIDEMFFDADELCGVFSLPLPQAAVALQNRILQEINIPVSMGIATSKTLAKLVSDTAKPFGCRVLTDPAEVQQFLRVHPANELTGIGGRRFAKLSAYGIQTCWDYASADRVMIRNMLTIQGEAIWWELHGEYLQKIRTVRPKHKCIGRGGSLGESTISLPRLMGWTVRNLERLIEELDFHKVLAGKLAYMVDFRDGGGWSGKAKFIQPTASFTELSAACREMLAEACSLCRPICRMQIIAEDLSSRDCVQLTLFPNQEPEKNATVSQVKASINDKLRRFAIRGAETTTLPEIYRDDASDFDICDVRGKICF